MSTFGAMYIFLRLEFLFSACVSVQQSFGLYVGFSSSSVSLLVTNNLIYRVRLLATARLPRSLLMPATLAGVLGPGCVPPKESWKMIQDPGKNPDPHQNLINCSFGHAPSFQEISSQSIHNLLRYSAAAHRQTDRQTDAQKRRLIHLVEEVISSLVSCHDPFSCCISLSAILQRFRRSSHSLR